MLTWSKYRVKISDKEKYVYSGYRKPFDSAGSWCFEYDTSRNVIIFVVDNSSPSHAENRKNKIFSARRKSKFWN